MLSNTYSRPSIPAYDSNEPTRLSAELEAKAHRLLQRIDLWAAVAVVALVSSASWYAATWLLERWQIQ